MTESCFHIRTIILKGEAAVLLPTSITKKYIKHPTCAKIDSITCIEIGGYEKNKDKLSKLLGTSITKKQLLKLIEDIGKEFKLQEDLIYYLDDYFRIIKDKANSCEKITKEIEKQIKSKKVSRAINSKLITLFFLRNITSKKRENKALSIFFSKNYKQALLLSYIGVNYGE